MLQESSFASQPGGRSSLLGRSSPSHARPDRGQVVRAGLNGESPNAWEHSGLRALDWTTGVQIEEKECF